MSKVVYKFPLYFAAIIQILCIFVAAQSETTAAKVMIDVTALVKVTVVGKFVRSRTKPKDLSFELSAAGFDGLGSRIKNLKLMDAAGAEIYYKTFIPGEYAADVNISAWSYEIDISPRKEINAAAHVSWANNDLAVLMLGDLLPQMNGNVELELRLPENWTSSESSKMVDASKAIIVAGADLHSQNITIAESGKITITTAGEWRFTDAESAEFTKQIFAYYTDLYGVAPTEPMQINIVPFPQKISFGEWQAETRGRNVTIVSSDMPFQTQSRQRLHEQLRHEIFHLWIPNLIDLRGNYDWFYEGFALYESLKLGLAVNQISFSDYLDTLSRAATIDSFQINRISLIDSSKSRIIGADTNIYARGMLIAFLCDAALLERSKGKRSVESILRSLFNKGVNVEGKEANEIVLKIMSEYPELKPIVKNYIEGHEDLDISQAMLAIGLENNGEGKRISLGVVKKPNGRQKEILNELGYNNWRKLYPKRK